jgi:hypothetical protein
LVGADFDLLFAGLAAQREQTSSASLARKTCNARDRALIDAVRIIAILFWGSISQIVPTNFVLPTPPPPTCCCARQKRFDFFYCYGMEPTGASIACVKYLPDLGGKYFTLEVEATE